MALKGGKRDRAILESIQKLVEAELNTLGWLDPGRAHSPLVLKQGFPDEKENVAANTIAFSMGTGEKAGGELGSPYEEHVVQLFIDMFADNEPVAIDVIGDIYAYLQENQNLPVRDYGQVGEPIDFYMRVESNTLEKRRSTRPTNPWQRHWWMISFDVYDDRPNV